ncbi:uncharacterized protein LOC117331326 [Pecten maximus]|uniref:uncharacterized protein LOC117331326 n=1 Tax=Pecten maximus TaxID=6579 RepID=UPI001457FCE2|nr:uncharacterized protein LOC117331326 [Pecten maximus]
MVSLRTARYMLAISIAEFAAVPPPTCCPVGDKNETSLVPDVSSLEAEWKQRLHSFENSLLLSVERRSLALAAVLMALTMSILLIGTCILSCRTDDTQYEPLSQDDWDTITSRLLQTTDHVDLKNHLYSVPFREPPQT